MPNDVPEFQISGDHLYYFERNRTIDGHPLGFEKFYMHASFETQIGAYDLEKSIGKLLLEILKLPIEKMVQEVTVVQAQPREAKLLSLPEDSDLMLLKRWLFIKGIEGAYQYYELRVPVGVSAFPSDLL
jgi:DNA-binding GntR family transcriptional regulator